MIVAVKRNKKRYLLKILFLLLVIGASAAYYVHLEKKHQEELKKEQEVKQALKIQEEKKEKKEKEKKELESLLLAEIEKTVELIGQENVRNIKIIEEKVIIVCEPATNLDALIIRYGAMAFIKKTLNEIVIAIDLNFLIKSRLNVK
jgi:hypothetical protein